MGEFCVRFNTNNAAFEPDATHEIAAILRGIAARVEAGHDASKHLNIRDVNGNVIGTFVHDQES